jgi:glutathione S-transferase
MFATISDIRSANGLRMAVIRGVPSPWTEAAKGIFYVKGLECVYGAQGGDDPDNAIAAWAGDSSVPVVAFENERLRTGWAEILLLAERLAPEPSLVPGDAGARADMFGIAHEICGEMGFGWAYRLVMIQASLGHGEATGAAFPPAIAGRLAARYGLNPAHAKHARARVIALLDLLSGRIRGRRYLVGDALSAADIYWATFANLIAPLPVEDLPAIPVIRDIYTSTDEELLGHLSAELAAHQRRIYDDYLELPARL